MQIFEVLISLETHQVTGSSLEEILKPTQTYLITEDSAKKIYICKGEKTRWVFSLIALRLAMEIKKHQPGVYSIEDLTPDKCEILKSYPIDPISPSAKIPELINPDLYSPQDLAQVMQKSRGVQIKQDSAWRERMHFKGYSVFRKTKSSEILEEIEKQIIPADYDLDMVLINNSMYAKEESLMRVLPEREYLTEFVKLGNLPEGRFFLPNYTPRVYVNKGSVRTIEFFQKQQPGQDLESHGEIHIEMLPFSRIQQEQDVSLLHEAFHIPPEESLEEFLAKQDPDNPSE